MTRPLPCRPYPGPRRCRRAPLLNHEYSMSQPTLSRPLLHALSPLWRPAWSRLGGLLFLLAVLLLAGCPKDPLGADNRLALVALGQCRHAQALQLTDRAIAQGSEHNVQQALMLKAAILLDVGDRAGAEALYPAIAEAWQTARRKELTPARRARELRLFLDVARDQRVSAGLAPDCGLPGAGVDDV